jgi:hypothetical protein
MFRAGVDWHFSLRKENNAFRGILKETGANTPEDDGPPCFFPYGPKASFKLRCESAEIADRALIHMYGSLPATAEKVHTLEWALVASISGGAVREIHRLDQTSSVLSPTKFNDETFACGKATRRYDSGLSRFVGKYDQSVPMTAVMAIEKGCHSEYGIAILFQQEKRRCLLLDTLIGPHGDSEAFWYTMMLWSMFQPRAATPRSEPGQLYYPAAATHNVEKVLGLS